MAIKQKAEEAAVNIFVIGGLGIVIWMLIRNAMKKPPEGG